MLHVCEHTQPDKLLARIGFVWQTEKFYSSRVCKDVTEPKPTSGIFLYLSGAKPGSRRYQLGLSVMELVHDAIQMDPSYVERMKRHYFMVKARLASAN